MGGIRSLARLSKTLQRAPIAFQNSIAVELTALDINSPSSAAQFHTTLGNSNQPPPSLSTLLHPRGALSSTSRLQFHRSISSTCFAAAGNDNKGGQGDDSDVDDEVAFQELAEAFSGLITTAYELMAQGRPIDAEILLNKGAEQAEEALGAGSVQVAPLWDQLALFQFMHDRCEVAQEASKRAWDAVANFAAQEGSAQARGAAATAAVRHATTVIGSGDPQTAAQQLATALDHLDQAIAELESQLETSGKGTAADSESDSEDTLEIKQYLEKFNTAKGEAQFYSTLCSLAAITQPTPEDVEKHTDGMEQGLRTMTDYLGPRHPLTACALREHNRLTEVAVDSEQGPLAETLYGQEIRLHHSCDPESEQIAALYYQLGTLQYCNDRHDPAIRSLERALKLLENEFEGAADHLITVKHRLGMALGASGKYAHARDVLNSISGDLIEKLGEGNPISKELEFMKCLMELKENGDGLKKKEKKELLAKMEEAVKTLKQFGDEHMLVKFAEKQFNEAKQTVESSS
jgi:tetratricopeptide (TPR) repeat protein